METVYIYSLIDPRDGEVKYVGKARDIEDRMRTHFKDAKRRNTPKNAWLRKLRRLGLRPEVRVLEEVAKSEWPGAEKKWIAIFRKRGAPLKNICDGGEGRTGPLSEETKRKLSIAGKGRVVTEETREKMRQSARERGVSQKTRDAAARMGFANRGRKHTAESRKKMSLASKGKKKSQEHRRKIGLAHRGRVFSEETKAKMRAARAGWKPPAELTRIQKEKCKGEGNGRAKLAEEQVYEIRERYARGDISLPRLARDYPVTFSAIHRIVSGQTWKHLLP